VSEDCINWNVPEWPLTAKAKALAPVLHEMTGGLARLFLRAQREEDPIIPALFSARIQVDWLLESTMDGSTWLRRFSSFEAEHNRDGKTARTAWLKALQDLGYTPRFHFLGRSRDGEIGYTEQRGGGAGELLGFISSRTPGVQFVY
jgi:hypothetical protein